MPSEPRDLRPADPKAAPLRMPKLTYRNRTPDPELITGDGDFDPHEPTPQPIAHDACPSAAQPVVSTEQDDEISYEPASAPPLYSGPRRSSASAVVGCCDPQSKTNDIKRKKHASLLGFFSLKEPSTSALEDFARQQQKHAAAKGGRITAVGLPGTSSQKLPSTVPKVNSKWDGLPSPIKDKGKEHRNTNRDSTLTIASRTSQSSYSSKSSSSGASMNSGASIQFANPFAHDSIAETRELRSDHVSNADAIEPHGYALSSPPLRSSSVSTPSKPAGLYVPGTTLDPIPQSKAKTSFANRRQRSDSVAEGVAGQNESASTRTAMSTGGNVVDDAQANGGQSLDRAGADHTTSQRSSHGRSKSMDANVYLTTPVLPPSRLVKVENGSRAANPSDKRHSREHRRTSTANADVLPWETQAPPPQPSTVPQKDKDKKRKLGFLSRRHI